MFFENSQQSLALRGVWKPLQLIPEGLAQMASEATANTFLGCQSEDKTAQPMFQFRKGFSFGFGLGFASECPVFLGQSAFLFGERFQPFGLLQKFLCPAFLALHEILQC